MNAPRIETARCVLRPGRITDLPAVVSAVRSPRFPARVPLAQMQDEELSQWLERMCRGAMDRTVFLWSIDPKGEDASCIGQISLASRPGSPVRNLAFWLDPRYWGRGIATEAVSAGVRSAFESLGVSEIRAGVAYWNRGSIRIIERLGFLHTGNDPAGYLVAGASEPVHEYRLTLADWRRRSSNG
jgi:RimJ/RimL family protein N-acetyltransferase